MREYKCMRWNDQYLSTFRDVQENITLYSESLDTHIVKHLCRNKDMRKRMREWEWGGKGQKSHAILMTRSDSVFL